MSFDEASTLRDTDGRFAEKAGTAAEISLRADWAGTDPLDDAGAVQGMLDADDSLPEAFRYEAVGEQGSLVVLMFAPADMDRSEFIDMDRSRVGKRAYRPHVRGAMTRISQLPGVVAVHIAVDEPAPSVSATPQGPVYAREGRRVVDMRLVGPEGEFTAPVPAERRAAPVEWLAQTGQYPVLERVIGPAATSRLLRKHSKDAVAGSQPADTLF